ncbi:hypothetical protein Tco_0841465 [Tanacetum coccineum]|uniref:Uncharacterized protein n=1 Tax=Tanacetum coccineum TaxID=301880 RepID=A0ABQ5AZX5_9ASTR
MENSKRGSIPMQDKLRLSKSQGASTTAELKRMQNVPYALTDTLADPFTKALAFPKHSDLLRKYGMLPAIGAHATTPDFVSSGSWHLYQQHVGSILPPYAQTTETFSRNEYAVPKLIKKSRNKLAQISEVRLSPLNFKANLQLSLVYC